MNVYTDRNWPLRRTGTVKISMYNIGILCPSVNIHRIKTESDTVFSARLLPHSLIRVLAGHSLVSKVSNASSGGQRRLWSACADALIDQSLRWAQILYGMLYPGVGVNKHCLSTFYPVSNTDVKTASKFFLYIWQMRDGKERSTKLVFAEHPGFIVLLSWTESCYISMRRWTPVGRRHTCEWIG